MKHTDLFNYQTDAMRLLVNSFERNKMVHAYLLDGEPGSGTLDACIYMAKKLICKHKDAPCMKCSDCKKIDSLSHLDLVFIEPISDMIKKEQISLLIQELSTSSMDSGIKVYIIKEAEKMNNAAANSLLKFLEEPHFNHYVFLTTTNFKRILPTITSRSQVIHFKPVPRIYLLEKLSDCGIEQDIGYVVSYLTSEFEMAMKYIEEGKITNLLTVAKKIVDKDLKGKDPYVEYYRNRLLFLEEKDKNYHRFFLDILILIYQEILKKENRKYFSDIINNASENITTEEIIRKLELLNTYQERFNYHINLDLQYTSLFSKL